MCSSKSDGRNGSSECSQTSGAVFLVLRLAYIFPIGAMQCGLCCELLVADSYHIWSHSQEQCDLAQTIQRRLSSGSRALQGRRETAWPAAQHSDQKRSVFWPCPACARHLKPGSVRFQICSRWCRALHCDGSAETLWVCLVGYQKGLEELSSLNCVFMCIHT